MFSILRTSFQIQPQIIRSVGTFLLDLTAVGMVVLLTLWAWNTGTALVDWSQQTQQMLARQLVTFLYQR
ncbi:hypothetical protein [Anthocerotibacter panamensis]|uniref:hypothetical protein n=1 Tax=Anthocerotibacter panamensis TaxID=2857077 RepID=UPI001C406D06|nr:hypothetical protein [Anthocerotibacter panamensis]